METIWKNVKFNPRKTIEHINKLINDFEFTKELESSLDSRVKVEILITHRILEEYFARVNLLAVFDKIKEYNEKELKKYTDYIKNEIYKEEITKLKSTGDQVFEYFKIRLQDFYKNRIDGLLMTNHYKMQSFWRIYEVI